MKYRILAFLFILSLVSTTVIASTINNPESSIDYYTLVGMDAPTTDVVSGANFAAYIASVHGIKFSGINDASDIDLENSLIVAIDGDHVLISTNENLNQDYIDSSKEYFRANGFSVRVLDYEDVLPEDLFIEEPEVIEEIQEPVINESEEICDGCNFNDTCYPLGTTKNIDELMHYCNGGEFRLQKGLGVDCLNDYECNSRICEGTCIEETKLIEPNESETIEIEESRESFFTKLLKKFFSWFN